MKRSAVWVPWLIGEQSGVAKEVLKAHCSRIVLASLLLVGTFAEAKPPLLPPPDPGRGSIGVTIRAIPPMKIGRMTAVQVYFARRDVVNPEYVVSSNYSNKKQVYLLNAKPGRYVAVAARLRGTGAGFTYVAFFPMEMLPETEVTVVPGELVFMGDFLVQTSTKMDEVDPTQSYFYRLIWPEAANSGFLARTFSGQAPYTATLRRVTKTVEREHDFWSLAQRKVFKKEPAWRAFAERQQQVLAGGTVQEQVVSQSFEEPSIEAASDDAEIIEAVGAAVLAAEEEIGPQSFSEPNIPIAGGEDVEILSAVEAAGTTAYFPEVQVRANVPEGWFTHNESVESAGNLFVTKERITGPRSKFRTGMTFYTHYELVMGREFADTASFTEWMFPLLLKSAKRQQKKEREFELETSLGTFRVLEALGRKKKANSIMWGAAQEAKGLFWFILEAPSEEWEESREQLLDLVRTVTLRSSGSPDDEIVIAAAHPWSTTYLLRTNRHKDELERRFKALRVGAPAAEYERIMGVQGRRTDRGFTNLTEGWLNRIYTSKTYTDFVDLVWDLRGLHRLRDVQRGGYRWRDHGVDAVQPWRPGGFRCRILG